ncbi:MAG: hypothetical protein RBU37_10505 [Myxococcota bacterium]|jgi:hypothetical protein|nr:hypothetical protein [Myxococcota bacterium]
MMQERVRVIEEPVPIILLDLSELKEPEYVATVARCRLFVETHSDREGLVMVDVSRTTATPAIPRGLKDTAVQTARCFRAHAVVGVTPIQMILLHAVSSFARLHLEACPDRAKAAAWLSTQQRN